MPAELRKREGVEPIDHYRVEDAGKYTDAELAGLLKDIFGLMDVPGTIKKLKAKELYFLAFGAAKKGVAYLPAMPLKPVAPPPSIVKAGGGAATGAAPQNDPYIYVPTDAEWKEMNRKAEIAENNLPPVDPFPPPDPDDVTPESEKRKRLAEKQRAEAKTPDRVEELTTYKGTLRGEEVELKDVEVREIQYTKRDDESRTKLRKNFDSTERKKFLQATANDPVKVKELKSAGLSDKDIAKMKYGEVPDKYNVHHKLPIDDGGTNEQDNFVLIKKEPQHKTITNHQNKVTRGMEAGDTRIVEMPIPPGFVYPK